MIYGACIVAEIQVVGCIEISNDATVAMLQVRQDTYWY